MANATAHVAASVQSDVNNRVTTEPFDAAAGTVYNGVLVGRDSTGYFTPADDTQALTEVGLFVSQTSEVDSSEADGTFEGKVKRGKVVKFKIATLLSDAAARAAYGRAVFAKYSDEVSLSPGTYGNFVGHIVGHKAGTYTEVYVWLPSMTAYRLMLPKVGAFSTPFQFSDDEAVEIHGQQSTATCSKALARFRVTNAVAKTGGNQTALHGQSYCTTALANAGEVCSILGEAGIKGTGEANLTCYAGRFKLEDGRGTGDGTAVPVWGGAAAIIALQSQLSAAVTGRFDAIALSCMSATAGDDTPIDSILYVPNTGVNATIPVLIEFGAAATCAVVAAGTYSTADGYFLCKVGTDTYRLPFYAAVD